jgi:YhcG PDDEXK nuclease domain
VVIDLKARAFEPEFAGKMNLYLAAVDDLLRHPNDQPSIGLIICKTKDQIIAEYALRNSKTPIGVSEYRLAESWPSNLKGSLPTIEELEQELGADSDSQETAAGEVQCMSLEQAILDVVRSRSDGKKLELLDHAQHLRMNRKRARLAEV